MNIEINRYTLDEMDETIRSYIPGIPTEADPQEICNQFAYECINSQLVALGVGRMEGTYDDQERVFQLDWDSYAPGLNASQFNKKPLLDQEGERHVTIKITTVDPYQGEHTVAIWGVQGDDAHIAEKERELSAKCPRPHKVRVIEAMIVKEYDK